MRNDFQISAEFHEAFSFSAYGLDLLCSMPSTFVPKYSSSKRLREECTTRCLRDCNEIAIVLTTPVRLYRVSGSWKFTRAKEFGQSRRRGFIIPAADRFFR